MTTVEEIADAAAPGWPRAFIEWDERAFPLPWVNSTAPATRLSGFVELDAWRVREAEAHRLCFCCGEPLAHLAIMGRHRASFVDDEERYTVYLTDGPAGHPRCVALAAAHCPHLRAQHAGDPDYVIALCWEGIESLGYVALPPEMRTGSQPRFVVRPGAVPLTLRELRALASRDPIGSAAL